MKDLIEDGQDVSELISSEIENLNDKIKYKFKSRYQENIELIKKSNFMLLRGHDVFDHLFEFLKIDNKNLKKSFIRKLSYEMHIPEDFKGQIDL